MGKERKVPDMDKKPLRISGLHKRGVTSQNSKECVFCGKLAASDCCFHCREIARQQIDIIADYLKAHPGANTIEICNKTSVPYRHVRGLFELGWLAIIEEKTGY